VTTSAPDGALQQGPLHDRHVALGAKLADFGGWHMPIEYPGGGVLKEHVAVREAVGVFDVSHLGKGVVRSAPGAAARGRRGRLRQRPA
jgi:aminomethyltransferase